MARRIIERYLGGEAYFREEEHGSERLGIGWRRLFAPAVFAALRLTDTRPVSSLPTASPYSVAVRPVLDVGTPDGRPEPQMIRA